MKHIIIFLTIFTTANVFAANENEMKPEKKIRYKEAGRIDFESLLIEGERNKPELSVVTGNIGEKDNGLMVNRLDFGDMMANDFGEVIE